MERLWYAVQRDTEDDLGTGSFDIFEARAMLIKQGFGLIIHRIGYDEVYTTDGKAVWYD